MNIVYNILPKVVEFFICGYIYLRIFRFIISVKSNRPFQDVFVEGFVVGYILVSAYNALPFPILANNLWVKICVTLVVARIAGGLYGSNFFKKVVYKLGIRSTLLPNIWDDIVNRNEPTGIFVVFKDLDRAYEGNIRLVENTSTKPLITISNYIEYKYSTDEVLKDFSEMDEQRLVIYADKVDLLEITYADNSKLK